MISASHKHFLLIIEGKSDLQQRRYETPRFSWERDPPFPPNPPTPEVANRSPGIKNFIGKMMKDHKGPSE